ncbi:DUF342 domain-containing protein [Sporolituus thermophilus]|uniref:Flagellar Assembly Protein A N-terminal region domain-containing protein n=1 Tax=Sporolituus thermophilus DSM 23256 TaxID=1123285 RepID=A0A1G7KQR7_9FIRM|nr:FapA family protein [Sporolituus thermophilus]SDF39557.1 hypothetical protein SAMN05660235_01436 [Sporolituus thermophilus DSM 23256]
MDNEERLLERTAETTEASDGYYQIILSDSGVFLTVFPPQGNGSPVREHVILLDLEKRAIKGFDLPVIVRTVREASGLPVRIAPPPPLSAEPEIQVLVGRDRMEATLQIIAPKGSRPVTMDEVLEKIKQVGVTYGLDHAAIQRAFAHPGLKVVCARGLWPTDGQDAYIKYYVDLENKGKPAELEDGRVDFKNLNMFTIVREGDLLAEKVPPTPGTPGIDVLGQPVPPKPGKDILPPLGKNVQMIDNGKIVATMSGQLIITNNKLNVVPVIEINGDVDLSTGNIDFVGNIIVRGSVQAGFLVKAEGDVEVAGTVSGGTVEGKNVCVRMGVQGMNRGYIKATENVVAKFIENATVYAGSDVLVSDVILHSRISAGKRVVVEGRRGLIAGGRVLAGEEIRAKVTGTHLASNTDLGVGINPLLREEYQKLRMEIKKLEFTLEQTQKALGLLRAMDQATMPKDKHEMMLRLTKAQFHLVGQVETMRNRINEIEVAFEEMRHGKIRVRDTVYPGVKIIIGSLVKPIRETLSFVTFYAEDGEIKVGPYK